MAEPQLSDFEILRKLGTGSFSQVYKVRRRSDCQEYAMKKVVMTGLSNREKQNAMNEVRILASLSNPQIIGYREAFFKGDILFIILEYCGGGDLQQKIEYTRKKGSNFYIEEPLIWSYLADILQGLNILHSNGIYHRDIKCANMFVTADHKHLKLGDLNVAKVAKTNVLASTQAGTPYYASPEVWKDEPYDAKCDIWSLGCAIYEMCQLQPPFLANDMAQLSRKVTKGVYQPIHQRYSPEMTYILSRCLQVDSKKRASCLELLDQEEIQKRLFPSTNSMNASSRLLNTIYLSKNYKEVSLPRPRYQTDNSEISLSIIKRPSSRTKSNNISQDQEPSPQIRGLVKKGIIPIMKRSVSQNASILKENMPNINLYQLPMPKKSNQNSPRLRKHLSSPAQAKKLQQLLRPEQDISLPPIEQQKYYHIGHRKRSSKYQVPDIRKII